MVINLNTYSPPLGVYSYLRCQLLDENLIEKIYLVNFLSNISKKVFLM